MASAMPTKNSSNGVNQPPSKAIRHRRRLSPAVREQEILSGAIEYFATFGFEGQIRGLAAQLGKPGTDIPIFSEQRGLDRSCVSSRLLEPLE